MGPRDGLDGVKNFASNGIRTPDRQTLVIPTEQCRPHSYVKGKVNSEIFIQNFTEKLNLNCDVWLDAMLCRGVSGTRRFERS